MKLALLDELEQQHREVESLFKMLRTAVGADEQRCLLERLVDVMSEHMAIEESEVYPHLANLDGVLVDEFVIEHDWARHELRRLSDMTDRPGFGAAVRILEVGVAHHVSDEEADAFPKLRQAMTDAVTLSTRLEVESYAREEQQARA